MNILVTGGCGFVGANLVRLLIDSASSSDSYFDCLPSVYVIDNFETGDNVIDSSFDCHYFDFDLSSVESIDSLNLLKEVGIDEDVEFDLIFHLAALARIQPSLKYPRKTLINNIVSTINILEFARQTKTKIIYAGSSSFHYNVYGSPYAFSKYNGEQLFDLYGKCYGVEYSIARFYNVYGPLQIMTKEYGAVIGIWQSQRLNNESLTIVGDGEQRRDFTHVDDIVKGLLLMSQNEKAIGETFELGTGKNYSLNEIADMFGGPREYVDKRPGEYPFTLCDNTKAREILGWVPGDHIEKYIYDWKLENNIK